MGVTNYILTGMILQVYLAKLDGDGFCMILMFRSWIFRGDQWEWKLLDLKFCRLRVNSAGKSIPWNQGGMVECCFLFFLLGISPKARDRDSLFRTSNGLHRTLVFFLWWRTTRWCFQIPSLKLTQPLNINGWKKDSFWDGVFFRRLC